ncbi:MAG: hypothetical protein MJ252_22515 [archaeon]|nr:hypothetical protein [archaeon]
MKIFIYFFILFVYKKILCWYSKCDAAGRCYIGNDANNLNYYPMPGYSPILNDMEHYNCIPSDSAQTTFEINAVIGYSIYGPLRKSKKGYECAGGLNECENSYCSQGKCSESKNVLKDKKNKIKIIYIITVSVFVGMALIYWGIYFTLGYKYNKKLEDKMFKEDQQYGNVVEPKIQRPEEEIKEENEKNEDDDGEEQESDEQDNSAIKSNGTEMNDSMNEEQRNAGGQNAEEKRRENIGRLPQFIKEDQEKKNKNESQKDKSNSKNEKESSEENERRDNIGAIADFLHENNPEDNE